VFSALIAFYAPMHAAAQSDLSLDQIQVVGTHNSYQMPADARVVEVMGPRLRRLFDMMKNLSPWAVAEARSERLNLTQINLEFRAEGFNLLNHHNLFIQQGLNDVANVGYGVPVPIAAFKGDIGNNNGANDERASDSLL
jgi:hypothetical protein